MEERESLAHAKEVFLSFDGMKNDKKYCDFTLKIGDEEIQVHRNILAACSKYFDAMFTHEMKETETGCAEILGIEPSAGKQCLDYIYTGKVKFSRDNPKDLIHAAELMQLHGLKDLYFQYLVEHITPENCLKYMELAVIYNQPSIGKTFEEFLGKNFSRIIKTEEFASMDNSLLSQCLKSLPEKAWDTEKLKWEAILAWVYFDMENRKDFFLDLFKLILLEKLPAEFLWEKISGEPLVLESDRCKALVFDAFRAGEHPSVMDRPGILHLDHAPKLLHRCDPTSEIWSRITKTQTQYSFPHFGELNVGVYKRNDRYDDQKWENLLGIDHCNHSHSHLKICNPFVLIVRNSLVIRYNTSSDEATRIEADLDLQSPYAIASSDDFIYAVEMGGKSRAREFSFDIKSWTTIASMNFARYEGEIVYFRGHLLAFGGYQLSDQSRCERRMNTTFEYYEPNAGRWIVLPECEENFFCGLNPKAFVFNDEFYVIENGRKSIRKVELRGF